MTTILILIHVIVSIALIMIVLLQTGKGADMGAVFGGGASQTLFGAAGASTFLSKATTVAAIIFMVTSLGLAYVSSHRTSQSIMHDVKSDTSDESKKKESSEAQKPATDQKAETGSTGNEKSQTAQQTSEEKGGSGTNRSENSDQKSQQDTSQQQKPEGQSGNTKPAENKTN